MTTTGWPNPWSGAAALTNAEYLTEFPAVCPERWSLPGNLTWLKINLCVMASDWIQQQEVKVLRSRRGTITWLSHQKSMVKYYFWSTFLINKDSTLENVCVAKTWDTLTDLGIKLLKMYSVSVSSPSDKTWLFLLFLGLHERRQHVQ